MTELPEKTKNVQVLDEEVLDRKSRYLALLAAQPTKPSRVEWEIDQLQRRVLRRLYKERKQDYFSKELIHDLWQLYGGMLAAVRDGRLTQSQDRYCRRIEKWIDSLSNQRLADRKDEREQERHDRAPIMTKVLDELKSMRKGKSK